MIKTLLKLAVLAGVMLAFMGLAFVVMYFREAVFLRLGDADQSLIFWYLPIFFLGVIAIVGGTVIAAGAIVRLKKTSLESRQGTENRSNQ